MQGRREAFLSAMRRVEWIAVALILVAALSEGATADECSTAVISGAASADGRPILWKNRDTDHLLNRVVFVAEAPYSYLGVVDADDASGGAAVFEVHNNGYRRLDASSAPEKYVLVTNFSRSGEVDQGRGYVRFERLTELFREDADGKYAFDQVLGGFTRDMRNPYVPGLDPAKRAKLPADRPAYVYTQQTIDRGSTASAVVIHGVEAGGSANDATMWVILGEPVCGIAVPLWVEAGEAPPELGGAGASPINAESMRLKGLLRPFKDAERAEYADLSKLENRNGTGWLDVLVRTEKAIIERTNQFLATNPSAPEKARFQKQIAAEALETLKGIR